MDLDRGAVEVIEELLYRLEPTFMEVGFFIELDRILAGGITYEGASLHYC